MWSMSQSMWEECRGRLFEDVGVVWAHSLTVLATLDQNYPRSIPGLAFNMLATLASCLNFKGRPPTSPRTHCAYTSRLHLFEEDNLSAR